MRGRGGRLARRSRSAPGYDPFAWVVWGRELAHLDLSTTGGPSFKPLPVLVTAVLSPAGDLVPDLWLVIVRACGLLGLLFAYRVAFRFAGVRGRTDRRARHGAGDGPGEERSPGLLGAPAHRARAGRDRHAPERALALGVRPGPARSARAAGAVGPARGLCGVHMAARRGLPAGPRRWARARPVPLGRARLVGLGRLPPRRERGPQHAGRERRADRPSGAHRVPARRASS